MRSWDGGGLDDGDPTFELVHPAMPAVIMFDLLLPYCSGASISASRASAEIRLLADIEGVGISNENTKTILI